MKAGAKTTWTAAGLVLMANLAACTPHHRPAWDARAAASYLDEREQWWARWPRAARDEHTFCVSCHTALPYALARPALRDKLHESSPSAPELKLLEDVSWRVRHWTTIQPYYPRQPIASRGTEAVLNALILSSHDAREGHLTSGTRRALQILWTLQDTSGANAGSWPWIQFNNEPWEAYDSRDYGAILAGLAIGMAPDDYRSDPAIQPALDRLRSYLDRAYPEQAPVRRVAMLWLSTRLPGVLSPDRRRTIIDEIWSLQRPDGGWCLAALGGPWKRRDGTTQAMQSDGYATGLAVLALQQSGISADDPRLHHGLAWLAGNQDQDGYWSGFSLNKRRIRLDDAARFMDDAATAYAVLALTQKRPAPTVAGQR